MNALTPRQRQIIELRLQGMRYKQIALTLGITTHTVKNTIDRAYERMDVCNMRQVRALLAGQEAMSA